MRTTFLSGLFAIALVAPLSLDLVAQQPPQGRVLDVSFDAGGQVTVHARNVTIREVLAEWARVGGSEFINLDQLTGGPVPMLEFEHQPETQVLASLLRTAAGYIVAPRTTRTTGVSRVEAVVILATSTATAGATSFASPGPSVSRAPGSPADEIPPVIPVPPPGNAQPSQPGSSTVGTPSPGVFVPIVPVNPTGGRGGSSPPTTGRGGRGGRAGR